LVSNVSGWADVDLWDVDDDQLLAAAQLHPDATARRGEEIKA
jgi:hypothetical protein